MNQNIASNNSAELSQVILGAFELPERADSSMSHVLCVAPLELQVQGSELRCEWAEFLLRPTSSAPTLVLCGRVDCEVLYFLFPANEDLTRSALKKSRADGKLCIHVHSHCLTYDGALFEASWAAVESLEVVDPVTAYTYALSLVPSLPALCGAALAEVRQPLTQLAVVMMPVAQLYEVVADAVSAIDETAALANHALATLDALHAVS